MYLRAWKKIGDILKDQDADADADSIPCHFRPKNITHCLRSTRIQQLMDLGAELSRIAMISGHSDLNTIRMYGSQQKFNPSLQKHLLPWLYKN